MNKTEYLGYLESAAWLDRRRKFARSHDAKCYCCDAIPRPGAPLDLHHLTYERLGREKPGDIVPVCRSCHDLIHGFSAMSVRAATERVRLIMARKSNWLERPHIASVRLPPPLLYRPRERILDPQPIHPGKRGDLWMSTDAIQRRRERAEIQQQKDRRHKLGSGVTPGSYSLTWHTD